MNNTKTYFSDKEFSCKCGCGKNNIDIGLIVLLNELREKVGFPLVINSGCRCEKRNAEEGGAKDSAHLLGFAVDIRAISSHTRFIIKRTAYDMGFERIGTGKTFIHLDVDFSKPQEVEWLY